jgi:hypothetical protein
MTRCGKSGTSGTIETAGTVGTCLKITLNVEPLNFELPLGFDRRNAINLFSGTTEEKLETLLRLPTEGINENISV